LYVPQNNISLELVQHEGEQMMTEFSFELKHPFNMNMNWCMLLQMKYKRTRVNYLS